MNKTKVLQKFALFAAGVTLSLSAAADPISPAVQARVDQYKSKLVEWAANPAVVAAVKDTNAKGAPTLTNSKWDELAENDATVRAYLASPVGKQLAKWEEDANIGKLFLRDAKGNLVAASSKALLFNNSNRPAFSNALKAPWADKEVKPDPTTQKKSVQIGVPVLDGGKPIGVLHAAVEAH